MHWNELFIKATTMHGHTTIQVKSIQALADS